MGDKLSKLCILAAGRGSRLGSLTANINKGMLPLDGKAVISHIIQKFPADIPIVIALGYQSDSLYEYIEAVYGETRDINYVDIDPWEGEGSGPGTSMWQCREHLQCPFYLTTIDCLIENEMPDLSVNWLGTSPTNNPSSFSTVLTNAQDDILDFRNKSSDGYSSAYIGLCGIRDYGIFWANFDHYLSERSDKEVENVGAFYDVRAFPTLKAKPMKWLDTGTIENYSGAASKIGGKSQPGLKKKIDEITYIDSGLVLKYSEIGDNTHMRGVRALDGGISSCLPSVKYKGTYIIACNFVEGKTLYEENDSATFLRFFDWCATHLWRKIGVTDKSAFIKFYKDKTFERVQKFLSSRFANYANSLTINGIKYDSIEALLSKVDWDWLCDEDFRTFHGDLNFGNAIVEPTRSFKLIDWRPDFGNGYVGGGAYYDLAKLYAGIGISWDLMAKDLYTCSFSESRVNFSYETTEELKKTLPLYERWLVNAKYELRRVKILAALSLLNMAPLHDGMFCDFLYFNGIVKLSEALSG